MQPPGEETLALFASLLAESHPEETAPPPLLAERVRRGWRRDEIVDWIRERFGIGEEKQKKVAHYWHELETGLLPVSGVSVRLREALSERFGEAVQAALAWELLASGIDLAFRHASSTARPAMELHERISIVRPTQPEHDQVDDLFTAQ